MAFSPDMMAQAQNMMKNMSNDDMKRMSDMASKMDPKTMESMMKNMGGGGMPAGYDPKQAAEQMKNMSPEQMRQGMAQAQGQMSAQKQYVYNGALTIKSASNDHIKNGKYSEALEGYDRAIENLRPHTGGDEVKTLQLQLLSNAALCHLKLKNFEKAMSTCEDALKLDPRAVKPTFRRGLAHEGLGDLSQALLDVKLASSLSPEDKTVLAELTRIRGLCLEKGINEDELKPKEVPKPAASSAKSFGPGPGAGAGGATPDMKEAMDAFAKNPEMMETASEMMKNMSEEDIAKMMPGVDPSMVKSQLSNPGMMKGAMEQLKSMPEEDRKKMLEQRQAMGSGGGMPDMASMSSVFENPEMMKQVAEMAKNQGGDDEQSQMMRQAAEQLQANPELGKQMSDMMKNMGPEQMQKMMEMSSKMKGGKGGPGGPGGGGDPMEMMNDPDMMKAAEDMMKSMSPEMLTSMAKQSGIDMDEGKAKMLTKLMPLIPYVMKCMRAFSYLKKGWNAIWSPSGKKIVAVVVLGVAVAQHYLL